MSPLAEAVGPWHEFYSLVGTASATLMGLLFVAASVGGGFYTKERQPALRAFLSPSIVHFASVLAACLIAIAPWQSRTALACPLAGVGLFGVTYAGFVWRTMVRHGYAVSIDREDTLFYAALPAASYAAMTTAGLLLLTSGDAAFGVLAAAMGVLLLIAIRNVWDMTVFVLMKRNE